MQRRKPSKALEKVAREVCDTDEFVDHIASISALYRREHDLEAGPRRAAVRQSLKTFERHAAALCDWLRNARSGSASKPERDALTSIGKAMRGSQHEIDSSADWLARACAAATQAVAGMKSAQKKNGRVAPRTAAEALRATFEHHRLKWTTSVVRGEPSPAIRLLCAIARSAGDGDLSPADARVAMRPKTP
jgi:hypothetical protein